jgi:PleD family two-component response regulator
MKLSVLVVEDNSSKADHISQIIKLGYDAEVEVVPTISGAYSVLDYRKWDLVILDMTFQVSSGLGHAVRKEALAGIELLQYMSAKRLYYPVIVATQHDFFSQGAGVNINSIEELDVNLKKAFPIHYRATVRVDLASSEWHQELTNAMRQVIDV